MSQGTLESKQTGTLFSPKRILVPVDGSENSKRALKVAAEIGERYESELVVLNVTTEHTFTPPASNTGAQYSERVERDAKRIVEEAVKLAEEEGKVTVRGKVVWAANIGVVGQIVESANEEKADLIVVGTRGLGEFKRLVLGSVSSGIVAHAPCRVLVER